MPVSDKAKEIAITFTHKQRDKFVSIIKKMNLDDKIAIASASNIGTYEIFTQNERNTLEGWFLGRKIECLKRIIDVNDPDIIWLVYHDIGAAIKDEEICNSIIKNFFNQPSSIILKSFGYNYITEKFAPILFKKSKDLDASYEEIKKIMGTLFIKKHWFSAYVLEKMNRGIDISQYYKEIPPSYEAWGEIGISEEFLKSLSPVKLFKFINTTEYEIPLSHKEIKRSLFPLIHNEKYGHRIEELLHKLKFDERIKIVTNVLIEEPEILDGKLTRFSSISVSQVVDFLKETQDKPKDEVYKFMKYLHEGAPRGALPHFRESINRAIKEHEEKEKI